MPAERFLLAAALGLLLALLVASIAPRPYPIPSDFQVLPSGKVLP